MPNKLKLFGREGRFRSGIKSAKKDLINEGRDRRARISAFRVAKQLNRISNRVIVNNISKSGFIDV